MPLLTDWVFNDGCSLMRELLLFSPLSCTRVQKLFEGHANDRLHVHGSSCMVFNLMNTANVYVVSLCNHLCEPTINVGLCTSSLHKIVAHVFLSEFYIFPGTLFQIVTGGMFFQIAMCRSQFGQVGNLCVSSCHQFNDIPQFLGRLFRDQ